MSYILKQQKLEASNKKLLNILNCKYPKIQILENTLLNLISQALLSVNFNDLENIKYENLKIEQHNEFWNKIYIKAKEDLDNNTNNTNTTVNEISDFESFFSEFNKNCDINNDVFIYLFTSQKLKSFSKKLLKSLHLLLNINQKTLSNNQLLQYICQSFFFKPYEEVQKTIFSTDNIFPKLQSKSLYYKYCEDSVRFVLEGNILKTVTNKFNTETHFYTIVSCDEVYINNVKHFLLKSSENFYFYIVNNKFHREDDKPALFILKEGLKLDDKSKTKIWIKNGLFHRDNNKPSIISELNEFIWTNEGKLVNNNYTNEPVYCISKDNNLINLELEKFLSKFSYDNT
jgi:hypothetical protein